MPEESVVEADMADMAALVVPAEDPALIVLE